MMTMKKIMMMIQNKKLYKKIEFINNYIYSIIVYMTRCNYCNTKKVGVIPFTCKCGFENLCTKCRLPFDHSCTFDFKKEGKITLEKQLPLIIADKLNKI